MELIFSSLQLCSDRWKELWGYEHVRSFDRDRTLEHGCRAGKQRGSAELQNLGYIYIYMTYQLRNEYSTIHGNTLSCFVWGKPGGGGGGVSNCGRSVILSGTRLSLDFSPEIGTGLLCHVDVLPEVAWNTEEATSHAG